jgi:hypothetical protein
MMKCRGIYTYKGEILGRMNSKMCGDVSVVMEMQEKQDISSQQSIIFRNEYGTCIPSSAVEGRKKKSIILNYKY